MTTVQKSDLISYPKTTGSKISSIEQRSRMWGWLFLSPWVIGFLLFYLLPMTASFIFTLTDFNLTHPDEISFNGFDNYRQLSKDPNVLKSLGVTMSYAALTLPIAVAFPLLIAVLLHSRSLWGKTLFRTLFYMPYIVPIISVTYIFNGFLNTDSGWLNRGLNVLGITGPAWLYDGTYIYFALIMISLWGMGNAMLISLAGLQTIPTELYEAAKVDGASALTTFRRITLPMMSPVIFYNLILALIGLFRYFEIPYILSRGTGGPDDLTLFYNLYFYRVTFRYLDMGFGSAMAWLLLAICLVVTGIFFATARFWVYYAGDKE